MQNHRMLVAVLIIVFLLLLSLLFFVLMYEPEPLLVCMPSLWQHCLELS